MSLTLIEKLLTFRFENINTYRFQSEPNASVRFGDSGNRHHENYDMQTLQNLLKTATKYSLPHQDGVEQIKLAIAKLTPQINIYKRIVSHSERIPAHM